MEKKEAYRPILPHYRQPGQAWFVTLCLWNAVAPGALSNYTDKLTELRWKIDNRKSHQLYDQLLKELGNDYLRTRRHYFNAFDRLMAQNTDRTIDLNQREIAETIIEGLNLWADTLLENQAWCIMPNHVHWVFITRKTDKDGNLVYLSDILEPVKNNTTRKINKIIGREGHLWQKESFDTPIKDYKHLNRMIEYTINNPVAAKFVKDRKEWSGSWGIYGL